MTLDLRQISVSVLVSVVGTAMVMEKRWSDKTERRVTYENQVTELQGDVKAIESRYTEWNKSISERLKERADDLDSDIEGMAKDLDGQVWTIQNELGQLREAAAFQRGVNSVKVP